MKGSGGFVHGARMAVGTEKHAGAVIRIQAGRDSYAGDSMIEMECLLRANTAGPAPVPQFGQPTHRAREIY